MTLEELEQLEKSATPGPWAFDKLTDAVVNAEPFPNKIYMGAPQRNEDAHAIIASRNILPEVIALARAVEILINRGSFQYMPKDEDHLVTDFGRTLGQFKQKLGEQ